MTKPLENSNIPLQLRVDAANAALAYMNACIRHTSASEDLRAEPNDAELVSVAAIAYEEKRACHADMLDCALLCSRWETV